LRLANPENISAVRTYLPDVPIIGITKPSHPHSDPENHVYITPSLLAAESVLMAGADIVAMDATQRPRPTGETLVHIVTTLRERFPKALLMADIATLEDGLAAADLGFDCIGTTLAGYTAETLDRAKTGAPDFELLEQLISRVSIPVIQEGRIWEPSQVTQSFELGATAVVIGSAITRPHHITKRFVQAVPTLKVS
jgi:N-acylglucosamine-6-phosphate 2-epimerase